MNFSKLITWSKESYSHLPWRRQRTLYRTLVSEIMLQQTTVSTVLGKFEAFLTRFPSVAALAESSQEDVLLAWKGLGYYRRARSLHSACRDIQNHHRGAIPTSKEDLLKIHGIGEYTASALLAIGADLPALAVDANLERVLARMFAFKSPKGVKLQKEIALEFRQGKLQDLLTNHSPRELNEAFMDLGRVFCQARKSSCEICPVKQSCYSFEHGLGPLDLPVADKTSKQAKNELHLLRIVVSKKGRFLCYQKSEKQWLSGQWELPTFILKSEDKALTQYPRMRSKISYKNLTHFKTGITKYKITNYILEMDESDFKKKFGDTMSLKYKNRKENLSTTSLKVLERL